MITITEDILKEIAPGSKLTNYKLLPGLVAEMNAQFFAAGIDTIQEVRHFLAQAAEETDSFNSLEEYASGQEYEGRKDLGNVMPGDGKKFKGKGVFQVTGYTNYKRLTDICPIQGVSFIENPELLASPRWAIWSALEYWNERDFNTIANMLDDAKIYSKTLKRNLSPLEYITWRINGGFSGLQERLNFYNKCKQVLS